MAPPFSRSLRSLRTDSSRMSLVGLALAMLLVAGWTWWFFLARITLYEASQGARMRATTIMEASFPRELQGRIRREQAAYVTLDGEVGERVGTLPALVTDVINQTDSGMIQARLVILWDETPPPLVKAGMTGRVEIETEYVSPAMLVLRSLGQFVDRPNLRASPQR